MVLALELQPVMSELVPDHHDRLLASHGMRRNGFSSGNMGGFKRESHGGIFAGGRSVFKGRGGRSSI